MNFLIRHVKLAGDWAKDFLSTSSNIIHIARCLESAANAVFCRDVTRFAASALVALFPIAHLGGCRKERPFGQLHEIFDLRVKFGETRFLMESCSVTCQLSRAEIWDHSDVY